MRPLQVAPIALLGIAFAVGCADPRTGPRALDASLIAAPAVDDAVLAGQLLAFASDRDGTQAVYVMNPDGSGQTRLTFNPADDFFPTWSPDGQKIAFESRGDGNSEVYVMNADGSNPVNLTNNPATDGNPAWSPRGDKI